MIAKKITNNNDIAKRADVLLAESNPKYSRAALAKLFDLGKITLEQQPIKAGAKIKSGQSFEADMHLLEKPADDIELPIIYEDESVLVVDKPSGVISHARGRYWDEASVASFIRSHVNFGDKSDERAGIVHRLDRATSGVMICAKNSKALKFLQKQFSDRKVEKTYQAIIFGNIEPNKGLIDIPIKRNEKKPTTFMASEHGKSAQTAFETIESNSGYSLIRLQPKTGRTHQIRVHLAYMGHPIIGDLLYGGQSADRLMLHASSLKLRLPGQSSQTEFNSAIPAEMEELLK